jgi:Family of unknown function (DUF6402)
VSYIASRSDMLAKTGFYRNGIGVYIRDSYDFNESQLLGFWDDKDTTVSMINPLSGTSVSNDDFRSWRTKNGKGGDFVVYSDLLKTRLPKPDVFDI